jgi:cold shock CspA family protein
MDSTSASSFVASFQFQEVDYFIMLVMTAFLGWHIGEMVRVHFKKAPKSKASKMAQKNKISDDDMVPQLKYPADSVQISQKGTRRIPPTQTPAARAAVQKSAGLEQLVSEITALSGQPPPGLPLAKAPTSQSVQDLPWRKASTFAAPVEAREDTTPRELGRIVCWKETGYGFVVNEAGERLFVRQAEVQGGEQLRAGQLIWFHRGKPKAGQAAKALNVTVVSQEEASVMRQSGSTQSASPSKAANKALAFPSASKKEVAAVPPPTIVADAKESSNIEKDVDLSAFLGAGSKEEQIKNLKYAPQWVADKFRSEQAEQQEL